MNDAWVRWSWRPMLCCAVGLACLAMLGCGGSQRQSQPREQSNLKKLALVYGRFLAQHRGQPPASEEEFKQFVRSVARSDQAPSGADDPNALFVSPRDGKPYVVAYGQTSNASGPAGGAVIAYEQEGKAGKRYVATALGALEEVDQAQFERYVRSPHAP